MDNHLLAVSSVLLLILIVVLILVWRRQLTWRQLYEANPLALFQLSRTQRLTQCNQAFAQLLGYSSSTECLTLFNEYTHYSKTEFERLEDLLRKPEDFDSVNPPTLNLVSRHGDRLNRELKLFQRLSHDRFDLCLASERRQWRDSFSQAGLSQDSLQHDRFEQSGDQSINFQQLSTGQKSPLQRVCELLMQQSLYPAFLLNERFDIIGASPIATRHFCLPTKGEAPMQLGALFPIKDRSRVVALIERRLAANSQVSLTFSALLKSAEVRECEWQFLKYRDSRGQSDAAQAILVLCRLVIAEPPLVPMVDTLMQAPWGYWTLDLVQQSLELSERWRTYLGFNSSVAEYPLGLWREIIAPQDQGRVIAALTDYLSGKTDAFQVNHRIAGPNGVERQVMSIAVSSVKADSGEIIRAYGLQVVAAANQTPREAPNPASELSVTPQVIDGFANSAKRHDLLNANAVILGYIYLLQQALSAEQRREVDMDIYIARIEDAALSIREWLSAPQESLKGAEEQPPLASDDKEPPGIHLSRESLTLSSEQQSRLRELRQKIAQFAALADGSAEPGGIEIELKQAALNTTCSICGEAIEPVTWLFLSLDQGGLVLDRHDRTYGFKRSASNRLVGGVNPLAQLSRWIHALKGHLTLDSGTDSTQLTVYVPNLVLQPEFQSTRTVKKSWRISVVDDQPAVTDFLTVFLSQAGYQVTAFNDPIVALNRLMQQPFSADLLITDQRMSQLSGSDLIRALRRVSADLPVILCSGDFVEKDADWLADAGVDWILKPFDPGDLLECIARRLGSV
jgi:CheY-like chemotaxis protein